MNRLSPFLVLCLLFSFAPYLVAGGGPENVIVVVNANSSSSKLIANHYVRLRNIPDSNVIYLEDIPDVVRITYDEFRTLVLRPIVDELRARKIVKQIDYIVYSADIPTQVSIGDSVNRFLEEAAKSLSQQRKKAVRRVYGPVASINSLTFFVTRVLADQPTFVVLNANKYMRTRNTLLLKSPFIGELQAKFQQALMLGEQEKYPDAIELLESLVTRHPKQVACHYWLARFYSRNDDPENALRCLTLATKSGWSYRDFTAADLAFEKLKDNAGFKSQLRLIPDDDYRFLPTMGFRSRNCWGLNGMPNADLTQGDSYVLSTVLAVTTNQGNSEAEAIAQLTRSVAADGTNPQGTFFFTDTSDVRSTTRKPEFAEAVKTLRRLGQEAEIAKAVLPSYQRAVAGLTIGTPSFSLEKSNNQFLPGAIGENLTSYGGALEAKTGQTKLSEFLRFGAAGSSGTVVEPLAMANKFPSPMIHCHYVRGCNLAESFYQSVHGPFQLLIVGDALCQPWARIPEFEVRVQNPTGEISGELALEPDFSKTTTGVSLLEFFLDGKLIKKTTSAGTIRLDTTKIPDGFHELRIVATADNSIQTTGRFVFPFTINNNGKSASLSLETKLVDEAGTLKLRAQADSAERIEIRHNGRVVAKIEGESGTADVEAQLIGRGTSHLMAFAYFGKRTVRSNPVEVVVTGELATSPRVTPTRKPKK